MKKIILSLFLVLALLVKPLLATPPDEGMWLPLYIKQLNEQKMKSLGMKLSADDIYSINHSSLKDAVVMFNSGSCTGEIVSDQGLVFTNHHCGYSYIANHSKPEKNYLETGFWATKISDELPNENLSLSILQYMKDVTEIINGKLNGLSDATGKETVLKLTMDSIISAETKGTHYRGQIKPFFEGNQYYLLVYETFKDIRLVGAPPSFIGKFGGNTDNWMWPRQTGDFSVFRIYTAPDGTPAAYSADNIPYKPKKHFKVNIGGIKKGDFSMILGFPGSTDRYLTGYDLQLAKDKVDPAIIDAYGTRIGVLQKFMDQDSVLKLAFATQFAQLNNAWKYYQGQLLQLHNLDVIDMQKKEDKKFQSWADAHSKTKEKYGNVLSSIESSNNQITKIQPALTYFFYGLFQNKSIKHGFAFNQFNTLYKATEANPNPNPTKADVAAIAESLKPSTEAYFEGTNHEVDKAELIALLKLIYEKLPADQRPPFMQDIVDKYSKKASNNDELFTNAVNDFYKKSILLDKKKATAFLDKPDYKKLKKDPYFDFVSNVINYYSQNLAPVYFTAQNKLNEDRKLYMQALMDWKKDKTFYPDANSTLRMTYGTVEPYYPRDGAFYKYYTTYQGILEKADSTNPEFNINNRMKDLLINKKFGRYAENDTLRINFLTNNDITGGNSGSPVIDAKGNLIGIAFDGNWESMIGDLYVDPAMNRTIAVDIRYVLWTMDIYANAKRLIDEITIVKE